MKIFFDITVISLYTFKVGMGKVGGGTVTGIKTWKVNATPDAMNQKKWECSFHFPSFEVMMLHTCMIYAALAASGPNCRLRQRHDVESHMSAYGRRNTFVDARREKNSQILSFFSYKK